MSSETTQSTDWPETESRVHVPGLWLLAVGGAVFSAAGIGFLTAAWLIRSDEPPDPLLWILPTIFVVLGIFILTIAVRNKWQRVDVLHAERGLLPDIPCEPMIFC